MLRSIAGIVEGVGSIASNIFGQRPAVEVPVVTNIQTTQETQDSGSMPDRQMQANPLAYFTPQVATGIAKNLPAIGRALGIGAGAGLGISALSPNDPACQPMSMKPYNVSKTTGCLSVTRKQQARLKEMVALIGLEATASAVGLDMNDLVLLLLKRFKARGRGITAASMRTTKRTIRQIKNLHAEVASMAGKRTVTRRGSTTKTSIVKA